MGQFVAWSRNCVYNKGNGNQHTGKNQVCLSEKLFIIIFVASVHVLRRPQTYKILYNLLQTVTCIVGKTIYWLIVEMRTEHADY